MVHNDYDEDPQETPPPRISNFGSVSAMFDSMSALTLALMLIGAGLLILIARSPKDLPQSDLFTVNINAGNLVSWLFFGAGLLFGLEVLARIAMPRYRTHMGLRTILCVVLVSIGVIGLTNLTFALSVLAIGLGLVVLVAKFIK